MSKAPTPTEKPEKQRDNTKTPPKTSITQRLRTDLGRSVGVMIATHLAWLNRQRHIVLPMITVSYCRRRRRLIIFEPDDMKFATPLTLQSV